MEKRLVSHFETEFLDRATTVKGLQKEMSGVSSGKTMHQQHDSSIRKTALTKCVNGQRTIVLWLLMRPMFQVITPLESGLAAPTMAM